MSDMTPPGIADAVRRTVGNIKIQDSVTFKKYSCETDDAYTELIFHEHIYTQPPILQLADGEIRCLITLNPGGGNPLHYHHTFTESFTPISGKLGIQLGSDVMELGKGHTVTAQRKQRHRFFNDSSESIEFHVKIVPRSPEFEQSIYIIYGLANDGLADPTGVPNNFFDLCVTAVLGDIKLAGWGSFLMPLLTIGAWYARWSGRENRLLEKYFK